MIQCKFCEANTETSYLYLECKHLSCLSCAFLRTDFSSQELECCQKFTQIEESSMEVIIKSKRNIRQQKENNQNAYSRIENDNDRIKVNPENIERDCYKKTQFEDHENFMSTEPEARYAPKISKIEFESSPEKEGIQEDPNSEFESILMTQIENIKRGFETQRKLLKEQEESTIKDLISVYESEVKNFEKPISQVKLEKFNASLTKRSASTHRRQLYSEEIPECSSTNFNNQVKPRENYNHILRRLETNQQRMKQRIQNHLEDLY